MTGLRGAREPEPAVPQWCINRAKDMAEARDADYWVPYLELVARENRMFYGEAFPEENPQEKARVALREERRKKAAANQRVIDPERFTHE